MLTIAITNEKPVDKADVSDEYKELVEESFGATSLKVGDIPEGGFEKMMEDYIYYDTIVVTPSGADFSHYEFFEDEAWRTVCEENGIAIEDGWWKETDSYPMLSKELWDQLWDEYGIADGDDNLDERLEDVSIIDSIAAARFVYLAKRVIFKDPSLWITFTDDDPDEDD